MEPLRSGSILGTAIPPGLPALVIVADSPVGSSTPQSGNSRTSPQNLGQIGCSRVRNHIPTRLTRSSSPCRTVSRSRMRRSIRLVAGPSSDDIPGPIYIPRRPPSSACFHASFHKKDRQVLSSGRSILNAWTLLDRKKVKAGVPASLRDGSLVDIPGYQLHIRLANSPATAGEEIVEAEELAEIPSYFYVPSPPPSSPVLTNLIEDRAAIALWSGGVTSMKVADIIEETADAKTFSARRRTAAPVFLSTGLLFVTLLPHHRWRGYRADPGYISSSPAWAACSRIDCETRTRRSCVELAVRPCHAGGAATAGRFKPSGSCSGQAELELA